MLSAPCNRVTDTAPVILMTRRAGTVPRRRDTGQRGIRCIADTRSAISPRTPLTIAEQFMSSTADRSVLLPRRSRCMQEHRCCTGPEHHFEPRRCRRSASAGFRAAIDSKRFPWETVLERTAAGGRRHGGRVPHGTRPPCVSWCCAGERLTAPLGAIGYVDRPRAPWRRGGASAPPEARTAVARTATGSDGSRTCRSPRHRRSTCTRTSRTALPRRCGGWKSSVVSWRALPVSAAFRPTEHRRARGRPLCRRRQGRCHRCNSSRLLRRPLWCSAPRIAAVR